ncbi:MAG: hypothetical protein HQK76_04045 [Desulfobacterales bacterium]|nr:hypothetical protein [Desulfobacterales bacterium]
MEICKKIYLFCILSLYILIMTSCSSSSDDNNNSGVNVPKMFEGQYKGTYFGIFSGTWELTIDSYGTILGTSSSIDNSEVFAVWGSVDLSGAMVFTEGFSTSGTTFNGSVNSSGKINGKWKKLLITGTFSGSGKFNTPSNKELEKFTGKYSGSISGDVKGDFHMGVDPFGNVIAIINQDNTAKGLVKADGSFKVSPNGKLTNNNLFKSVSIKGIISEDGQASGTWSNSYNGQSGSINCKKYNNFIIPKNS